MMAAKVKLSTGTQVIAARFLNAETAESTSGDVQFQSFVNEDSRQKKLVAAVGSHTYVGDEADSSSECKYYIAKYDRRTSKLRVYDARLFNMAHYDEAFLKEEKEQQDLTDAAKKLQNPSFRDSVNKLTLSFGASWKKRAVVERLLQEERSAQNKTGSGRSTDYILTNEGDLKGKLDEVKSEMESSHLGPPCNKEAETPPEAYPLDGIVSSLEMTALEEVVEELMNWTPKQLETWRKENRYPSFVLAQLQLLPMDKEMRQRQVLLLCYLSFLIHLHNLKSAQMCRKDPLPHTWPQVIRKKLLEKFAHLSVNDRKKHVWKMSPMQKDDLVAHIIILALHICDFTLPIRHIRADVKMLPTKFLTRAAALGCHTSVKKATEKNGWKEDEKFVILKVPLKFQTVHYSRSKRKV